MNEVKLVRGDSWRRAWLLKSSDGQPVDITGASARLHVRDRADALVMSADTADGRITLDGPAGRIDLHMPFAATQVAPGRYWWDIELTLAGVRTTIERGALSVVEDASHD
ncbi:MAG: hypothetical protein N2439_05445 [Anaerolineae bacterium]|nr:hypothetical protein [Anaerolineae bacterium]